jgi:hypothetical protein
MTTAEHEPGRPDRLVLADESGRRVRVGLALDGTHNAVVEVEEPDPLDAAGFDHRWRPVLTLGMDALGVVAEHAQILCVATKITERLVHAASLARRERAPVPSDIRPHVPHEDDRTADHRVHLMRDKGGVAWCGARTGAGPILTGTRDAVEADCGACREELHRAVDTRLAQVAADSLDGRERAQARHDAAGNDLAVPPGGDVDDGPVLGHFADPADRARVEALAADAATFAAAAREAQHDAQPPVQVPRGWDRIKGGGELIEMTDDVIEAASHLGHSWWTCRYCGHGDVVIGRRAADEGRDCLDHEAHCEHNPDRVPGSLIDQEPRRG